jgi:hypothetical protein
MICLPLLMHAQKIRVINSTAQQWSGGIAGRRGCNYHFAIEFSRYKSEPLPDTLWLGQQAIILSITDSNAYQGSNTKRIRAKGSVKFEINAGTINDRFTEHYANPLHKTIEVHNPPFPYTGVALLSYKYRGRKCYFQMDKIKRQLQPLNYP